MALDIHVKTLSAGAAQLVSDLHLHCAPGRVLTLMGASGSGKSSVLSAVCGTLEPGMRFDGEVMLNGRSITHLPCAQRHIGILFQHDLLFSHMSVVENLLFAVPPGPSAQRRAAVQEALAELGFSDMAQRSPNTLSGGQRARVSLLRTLLAQPHALLLDEPFSKLDAALRQQFRDYVFDHVKKRNLPTLLVTHDAADIADSRNVITL